MNRNIGILFGVIPQADSASADDIGVETAPFTSTVTRAEVVADFNGATLIEKDSGSRGHDDSASAPPAWLDSHVNPK